MSDEIPQVKEKLIDVIRKNFQAASEADFDIRKEADEDIKFRAGDQWPEDIKAAREQDNRPCLVINRIPQFIRQVSNEQRQNRPAIKVSAVDNGADADTAQIFQGLIRHIEYDSGADVAYDSAFQGAVEKSFGYFRIITDYVDGMSFDQCIKIKHIPNHFSVYMDPNMVEPDGSDANWAFVFEEMSKDVFKKLYPKAKASSMEDWTSLGDEMQWFQEDKCRVAEYFYKEMKHITIVRLSDGTVWEKSKILPEMEADIVDERETVKSVVKWVKTNGIEILEETDWPSQWIPIIPVFGDILYVGGKKIIESLIRHARDPQRMYNYWASTKTETIALAPKAPFIVAEGQIPPEYEGIWKSANVKNHAYLPYKPTSIAGQPIGAPQRNAYEPPIAAISQALMQSADDLKATTGIYDASLGARSNENSGIAIARRNAQSQTSNYHFLDNLTRALRHTGRILIDLIPKIYDTPRAVRILGEDNEQKIVQINQIFQEGGKSKAYFLGKGKYDVIVETGPSYATKRQESAASLIELAKAIPQIGQVAPDLIVKNFDFVEAKEVSQRLKSTVPPNVLGEEQEIPPAAQAQIAQSQQIIQQLSEQLQQASQMINNKVFEVESKERIEMMKLQNQLTIEQMKLEKAITMETVKTDLMLESQLAKLNMSKQNGPAAVQGEQ